MSRHATRYNKRDLNETIIVNTLHELGLTWLEAPPLDGWVWLGQWIPVEIKTPTGRLTKGQQDFVDACTHWHRPVLVWRSQADAWESVQHYRSKL